jgi:hypothetical protein
MRAKEVLEVSEVLDVSEVEVDGENDRFSVVVSFWMVERNSWRAVGWGLYRGGAAAEKERRRLDDVRRPWGMRSVRRYGRVSDMIDVNSVSFLAS